MNDQSDRPPREPDGWPLPTPDVRRELEAPALVWSEPEPPAGWPLRRD